MFIWLHVVSWGSEMFQHSFIWLHVVSWGSEMFQHSRLSVTLLSCCWNLLTRCLGQFSLRLELYFITNPTN
jgi:hypothetical protein